MKIDRVGREDFVPYDFHRFHYDLSNSYTHNFILETGPRFQNLFYQSKIVFKIIKSRSNYTL